MASPNILPPLISPQCAPPPSSICGQNLRRTSQLKNVNVYSSRLRLAHSRLHYMKVFIVKVCDKDSNNCECCPVSLFIVYKVSMTVRSGLSDYSCSQKVIYAVISK